MREKLLGLLLGGQGIRPAEKICNISYSRRLRFDKGAQKVKLRAFLDRHGSSNGTSFLLTGLCVNPITTFTPTTHHIFTTTTTRCITLLSLSPRFCTLPNKKSVRCSLCINIGVPNILHIINPQPGKMLPPPDQHYTVSPNYFTSQEQGEMQGVNFIPAACSLMERKECYASASFFTTEQSGATE